KAKTPRATVCVMTAPTPALRAERALSAGRRPTRFFHRIVKLGFFTTTVSAREPSPGNFTEVLDGCNNASPAGTVLRRFNPDRVRHELAVGDAPDARLRRDGRALLAGHAGPLHLGGRG